MNFPGDSNATVAPSVWCKHIATASVWCAIKAVADGSAQTYCGGRWATYDATQFDLHDAPPEREQCASCVRVINAERVLVDFTMPDDRFDDGGES